VKRFSMSCRAAEIGASACCNCSEVTYCCVGEEVDVLEAAREALLLPCHGCADALCAALRIGGARDSEWLGFWGEWSFR
jgi:hypothetical protein